MCPLIAQSFFEGFSAKNVISSFLATGLYSFDPGVISLPRIQSKRDKAIASKLELMLNNKEQNVLNKINDNRPKKRATFIGPSGENVTSDIFLTKKQERMRKCDKTQTQNLHFFTVWLLLK